MEKTGGPNLWESAQPAFHMKKFNSMKIPKPKEMHSLSDYNTAYRVYSKKAPKIKPIHAKAGSKAEVGSRKKVKTAGDTNPESLFQTTFGSFTQIPHYKEEQPRIKQKLEFHDSDLEFPQMQLEEEGLDANTPTLPYIENQGETREGEDDVPRQIPIIENSSDKNEFEYSYQNVPYKAKSSHSLRKNVHQPVQKNIFFITDKNFMKFRDRNTPSVKDIQYVAEINEKSNPNIIVAG